MAHVLGPDQAEGQALGRGAHGIGPDADLHAAPGRRIGTAERDGGPGDAGARALNLGVQQVHSGRADEVAHEGMRGRVEQRLGRARLHDAALGHDDDLVGEGQRLGLIVGDIDHRVPELAVKGLELGAKLPLHLRVNHGQRLVEKDRVHVLPDHAAAEADLLLGVRRQAARPAVQRILHPDHAGDGLHPRGDLGGGKVPVLQRKGEVLADGHGVVDDGELEHLRDVAPGRGQVRHVAVPEQHPPARRPQQPRDDVQQRGLAATGRPQQRIGPAVAPGQRHGLQRPVGLGLRGRAVAVGQVVEGNPRHHAACA